MPFSYGDDSVVLSARPYLKLHSGRAFSYSTCSLRCSLSFGLPCLGSSSLKQVKPKKGSTHPEKPKALIPNLPRSRWTPSEWKKSDGTQGTWKLSAGKWLLGSSGQIRGLGFRDHGFGCRDQSFRFGVSGFWGPVPVSRAEEWTASGSQIWVLFWGGWMGRG